MRIALALGALLVLLPSCGAKSPESSSSVLLRHRFEGQKLTYKSSVESTMDNPSTGEIKLRQSSTDAFVMKKSPEGEGFAEVTRGNIEFETTMFEKLKEMGMEVPDVGEMLGAMDGLVFRVYMSERGHIKRIEGMDEAVKRATAKMEDPMAGPLLSQSFSDEALSNMLKQSQAVLPEEAIVPGATWKDKVTINAPMGAEGTIHVDSEMTLRKIETVAGRRVAMIDLKMTLTGDLTMMGIAMKQEGTATGETRFDVDGGYLRYQHIVTETTTTTEAFPKPMTMTMGIKLELQE